MRAGIASGFGLSLTLGLVPALFATAGLAADAGPGCQTYVDAQWKPSKASSMSHCLLQIDAATTVYDAQGFKFGLWGTTLLSADLTYFYSSMDSGASWQVVGQKASISPDAGTVAAAAQAPKPAVTSSKSSSVFGRVTDFFVAAGDPAPAAGASEEVLTPKPVTADMPAPATVARTEAVGQNSVLAAAAEARPAPAPAVTISQAPQSGEPRASCNMRLGSRWEVISNQTLQQCITLFDRSPDQFDANGYKYGYWGGTYLAADRKEVLQSTNSRDWTTVLTR